MKCTDSITYWNTSDVSQDGYNWESIRAFIRAGKGPTLFPVGTIFTVHHEDYHEYDGTDIQFRVVGHDQVPAADSSILHTMCLDMVNILFYSQYDAPLLLYALTEDAVFQADKIYYTFVSGSTYASATVGTDYTVNTAIPESVYYEKNVDTNRSNYGSNNPENSNLLQWANSEGLANNWFQKKTIFDQCTSYLVSRDGFMRNLDAGFKSVLVDAQLTTAKAKIDGAGAVTQIAKMFPLSYTQAFGYTNNSISENQQLAYYTDTESRIKYRMDTGNADYWWLRSPNVYNSYYVYYVYSDGRDCYFFANFTLGVSLACIIG